MRASSERSPSQVPMRANWVNSRMGLEEAREARDAPERSVQAPSSRFSTPSKPGTSDVSVVSPPTLTWSTDQRFPAIALAERRSVTVMGPWPSLRR